MRRFASDTSVSVEKTKAEIEGLVMRYGGQGFLSGWQGNRALIQFLMRERMIRFVLELPDQSDKAFARTPKMHQLRSAEARMEAWEQACRSRWRALHLAIKAKLEAVAIGISVFDNEFLGFIVDPSTGRTLGEQLVPEVVEAYRIGAGGRQIRLLPGPSESQE